MVASIVFDRATTTIAAYALGMLVGIGAAFAAGDGPLQPLYVSEVAEMSEQPLGLTLSAIEDRSLARSPSLAAVEARIRAARWQSLQVGLRPNPRVGYVGSEIGNEGQAGQQGAFISQQLVRGGKLERAQAVACKEVKRLRQELAVERYRVLTDTRTAFYETYLAQLEIELLDQLTTLGKKAAEASGRLAEAGEGPRTDALLAQIEQQRAAAKRRQAEQRSLASWRRLAALTGMSQAAPQALVASRGDLLKQSREWHTTLRRVLAASPAVASRVAAIEKARCEISYQRSLAVPDITTQFSVQYDDSTNDTLTGVQVGMPLQLWNRNQGSIGRAQAELTVAKRRLEATEQALERRLADVFGRYEAARLLADSLETEVLPRAQENLDLATEGYEAGEINFLDLLTVQRTYFEVSLESLATLRELNTTTQLIRGCLLAGSGGVD